MFDTKFITQMINLSKKFEQINPPPNKPLKAQKHIDRLLQNSVLAKVSEGGKVEVVDACQTVLKDHFYDHTDGYSYPHIVCLNRNQIDAAVRKFYEADLKRFRLWNENREGTRPKFSMPDYWENYVDQDIELPEDVKEYTIELGKRNTEQRIANLKRELSLLENGDPQ